MRFLDVDVRTRSVAREMTFLFKTIYLVSCFCGKTVFDFIKSFANGYEPLDLSRIQSENASASKLKKSPVDWRGF